MSIILHITTSREWKKTQARGCYRGDTLSTQGFVHCTEMAHLLAVADRWFGGRRNLVLLCIETEKVDATIRYENLEGGEVLFPHVYGPVALEAIVSVFPLDPGPDGRFSFPPGLEELCT